MTHEQIVTQLLTRNCELRFENQDLQERFNKLSQDLDERIERVEAQIDERERQFAEQFDLIVRCASMFRAVLIAIAEGHHGCEGDYWKCRRVARRAIAQGEEMREATS